MDRSVLDNLTPGLQRDRQQIVAETIEQEKAVLGARRYRSKLKPLSTIEVLLNKSFMSERFPEDLTVDPDNVVLLPSSSSIAAVAGEITVGAGLSVNLQFGGSGTRAGIIRRFVLGGDANAGRLQLTGMTGTYLKAPLQGNACGLPGTSFLATALKPFKIDCPIDAGSNLNVTFTNPTAGNIVFSIGAEVD